MGFANASVKPFELRYQSRHGVSVIELRICHNTWNFIWHNTWNFIRHNTWNFIVHNMHITKHRRLLQYIVDFMSAGTTQCTLQAACSHVAVAANTFRSNDVAHTTCSLRAQYALALVKVFIEENEDPSLARAVRLDMLKVHTQELIVIDVGIGDDNQIWDATWSRVLTTAEPSLIAKMAADKSKTTELRRRLPGAGISTQQASEAIEEKQHVTCTNIAELYNVTDDVSMVTVQM